MKTSQEIEILSWQRLEEAKVLYANQMYDGAFYLAGYSVELMLKSRICTKFTLPNLFDETDIATNIIEGISEIRRAVKTHNLFVLLTFAGLREEFDKRVKIDSTFDDIQLNLFERWSEQTRYYSPGTIEQTEIEKILEFLDDKTGGFLQWICNS
jgi:hypothetical protein